MVQPPYGSYLQVDSVDKTWPQILRAKYSFCKGIWHIYLEIGLEILLYITVKEQPVIDLTTDTMEAQPNIGLIVYIEFHTLYIIVLLIIPSNISETFVQSDIIRKPSK